MSLIGTLVKTAVNIAALPVAVAKDVITLGGATTDRPESYTSEQIQKLKDEAEDND